MPVLCSIARITATISAGAQAELNGLASRMRELYPDEEAGRVLTLVGLQERVTGQVRPALLLLLGAVLLVLLVACANLPICCWRAPWAAEASWRCGPRSAPIACCWMIR